MSGFGPYAYYNNGLSFRSVPQGYIAQTGEVVFSDTPTPTQLANAFSGYTAAAATAARQPLVIASQAALTKTDVTIIRILESGQAVPSDIIAYRAALRAIRNGTDTTSQVLPTAPTDFPSGT